MKTAVEERRVIVDGLSIRYFTAGNYDPPLVLLHRDGESAVDWSWVIPKLAANHCVYALDLPGSGDRFLTDWSLIACLAKIKPPKHPGGIY